MTIAAGVRADVDPVWNSPERYDERETRVLDNTDMNAQRWVSPRNPVDYRWVRDFLAARRR
jgi:hypothetical protein